jgi:Ca2+-binding EF-hand superfamily protein
MNTKNFKSTLALTIIVAFSIVSPSYAFFKPSPEKMMSRMDNNNNSEVTEAEMLSFMDGRRGMDAPKVNIVFTCLDQNEDQKIDTQEIQRIHDVMSDFKETQSCLQE